MRLAIFDLDNTLLGGDSDYAWGEFMIKQGLADPVEHQRQNDYFYEQYKLGRLDMEAYVAFALGPVARLDEAELDRLHRRFMREKIAPMRLPAADALLERHRAAGDYLMIITATNSLITGPIARAMGVHALLATDPERADGRLTGRILGTPCYQAGKVARLEQWLQQAGGGFGLAGSYFYSDSHNDLPLLERVEHPVAVDPDAELEATAHQRGWPVISLR